MESNKSIHRSNEQKNLYKALVGAYESDKLILDTYGDIVSFKRSYVTAQRIPSSVHLFGSEKNLTLYYYISRVLPGQGTVIPPPSPCTHSSDVAKLKKSEKRLTKQVKMFMKLFRSDDKFSQMLTQLESQPEYGGGSGSGGCGDDEPGDDEDGDEDEEDG
ncbi:hypothetical protein Tco_1231173 [Tanacetum coccineum]